MGSFNDGLKAHATQAIFGFQLADGRLGVAGWSSEHRRFLNFCFEEEILTEEELEKMVSDHILQLGRESYRGHIDANMPPDHTVSPHALAYAIRSGGLTDHEVNKIKFDHGQTRYTFCKGAEDTLVKSIMDQLRNPEAEWP